MAQQIINRGSVPNDPTGDTAYEATGKMNSNFTELYDASNVVPRFFFKVMHGVGEVTPEQVAAYVNLYVSMNIGLGEAPVIFRAARTDGSTANYYYFHFEGGSGKWGHTDGTLGWTPVTAGQFKLTSVRTVTPESLTDDPNTQVIPLGYLADGDFITEANTNAYDWSDALTPESPEGVTTYIFAYIIDNPETPEDEETRITVYALFVAEAGEYGFGTGNPFEAVDFVDDYTNSEVPPAPGLQQVLAEDNVTTLPARWKDSSAREFQVYKSGFKRIKVTDGVAKTTDVKFDDPTHNVTYKIPAKASDDVFSMLSDLWFIDPNRFTGTDTEKIQAAVDFAVAGNIKNVAMGYNAAREESLWLIDEAILLTSNINMYVVNSTLKLSDTSRDNMVRTANCGFGITEPWLNPFENISIIGIGSAVFEGADNPRSSSYNGRALSVTSNTGSGVTYGSDALDPEQKQDGDWRSTMMIFAFTTNILVENIQIKNAHGFAVGFERCHYYTTNFTHLDCPRERTIAGNPQRIFNCDGLKAMQGGTHAKFLNTTGHTDDNMITMGIFGEGHVGAGDGPGVYTSNTATGSIWMPGDDIRHVTIGSVHGYCYQSIVRGLNTGNSVIDDVVIYDIKDTSVSEDLVRTIGGGACIFGSFSPDYGGPTPLGNCSNIHISDVVMRNSRYGINVEGSLDGVFVNNFSKLNSTDRPAIYINPSSGGVRNVVVSNIYDSGSSIIHTGVYNGLSSFTGTKSDIIDAVNSKKQITLTGTSGTANINIDGTNYTAEFATSLSNTATQFVSTNGATILSAKAVTTTSHTVVLDFVHATAAFPSITITNVTGDLSGTVGSVEVIKTTSSTFTDPNSVGLSYPAGSNYTLGAKTLVPNDQMLAAISAEAAKNKVLIADTVDGTDVTGTLSQTITKYYLIPANTTAVGTMTIEAMMHKTGTTGSVLYHVYTNTTNSLSGATLIAGSGTVAASNRTCVIARKCYIKTGGTFAVFPSSMGASVPTVGGAVPSSITFDPTVNNYIIFTVTLSDITDAAKITGCEIVSRKQ